MADREPHGLEALIAAVYARKSTEEASMTARWPCRGATPRTLRLEGVVLDLIFSPDQADHGRVSLDDATKELVKRDS